MALHVATTSYDKPRSIDYSEGLRYMVPLGRLLFALIYLAATPVHFSARGVAYAASQGVPFAAVLVPFAGVIALVGALSVLLGYKARIGALLLIVFLVPVTLTMHRFWAVGDAQAAMVQRIMFMKNVSLLGAALLIAHFGAGPISIDRR